MNKVVIFQDGTTGRFSVIETDGRYGVVDTETGRPLRFSFERNDVPFARGVPTLWNNPYSARGFAQRMAAIHGGKAIAQ